MGTRQEVGGLGPPHSEQPCRWCAHLTTALLETRPREPAAVRSQRAQRGALALRGRGRPRGGAWGRGHVPVTLRRGSGSSPSQNNAVHAHESDRLPGRQPLQREGGAAAGPGHHPQPPGVSRPQEPREGHASRGAGPRPRVNEHPGSRGGHPLSPGTACSTPSSLRRLLSCGPGRSRPQPQGRTPAQLTAQAPARAPPAGGRPEGEAAGGGGSITGPGTASQRRLLRLRQHSGRPAQLTRPRPRRTPGSARWAIRCRSGGPAPWACAEQERADGQRGVGPVRRPPGRPGPQPQGLTALPYVNGLPGTWK